MSVQSLTLSEDFFLIYKPEVDLKLNISHWGIA